MVVLGGVAVSYERGTPVRLTLQTLHPIASRQVCGQSYTQTLHRKHQNISSQPETLSPKPQAISPKPCHLPAGHVRARVERGFSRVTFRIQSDFWRP